MFARFHTAFYIVGRSVLFLHLQNPNIKIIQKKYLSSRMPKKIPYKVFFHKWWCLPTPSIFTERAFKTMFSYGNKKRWSSKPVCITQKQSLQWI